MLIVSPIQCKGTIVEWLFQRLSQSDPKRVKLPYLCWKQIYYHNSGPLCLLKFENERLDMYGILRFGQRQLLPNEHSGVTQSVL